jgi:hypothetical protein
VLCEPRHENGYVCLYRCTAIAVEDCNYGTGGQSQIPFNLSTPPPGTYMTIPESGNQKLRNSGALSLVLAVANYWLANKL